MEKRINIAELLWDCPKGMELDCTMFSGLEFDRIDENNGTYPIICRVKSESGGYHVHTFTEHGHYSTEMYSKCVIYPKGKTTWEGFQRPFKDGAVIYNQCIKATAIFCEQTDSNTISHCFLNAFNELRIQHKHCRITHEWRFATEEEKQTLFKAIKENGYRWNAETKVLEKLIKPEFKVGNRIKRKGDTRLTTIKDIRDNYYIITFPDLWGHAYITDKLLFSNQGEYEIIPNKFDISTLVPFESRVLVRSVDGDLWKPAIYGFPHSKGCFVVGGVYWGQCIPYEENKELLGTTNNLEEYGSR